MKFPKYQNKYLGVFKIGRHYQRNSYRSQTVFSMLADMMLDLIATVFSSTQTM